MKGTRPYDYEPPAAPRSEGVRFPKMDPLVPRPEFPGRPRLEEEPKRLNVEDLAEMTEFPGQPGRLRVESNPGIPPDPRKRQVLNGPEPAAVIPPKLDLDKLDPPGSARQAPKDLDCWYYDPESGCVRQEPEVFVPPEDRAHIGIPEDEPDGQPTYSRHTWLEDDIRESKARERYVPPEDRAQIGRGIRNIARNPRCGPHIKRPEGFTSSFEPTPGNPDLSGQAFGNGPDTNPKTRAGGMNKLPMHLIPPRPLAHIALAFADGGFKYQPYNWHRDQISASVYYGAALRHLHAWWGGEDEAPDAVAHHLAHAACCLLMLLDTMDTGLLRDNRPPAIGEEFGVLLEELAERLPELRERESTKYDLHDIAQWETT